MSPIARRFAIYTIMCSSLIALVITVVQLSIDYHQGLNAIKGHLGNAERSFVPSISQSLWNLDEPLINTQLQGIAQLDGIAAAYIKTPEKTYSAPPTELFSSEPHEYRLSHFAQGERFDLGTLTIVTSKDGVYSSLIQSATFVLLSNTFKTLIVSFAILLIFQILIGRYLVRISSFAETAHPNDLQHLSINRSTQTQDELSDLVNAINGWVDTQARYHTQEVSLREEIKKQRDELKASNKKILASSKEVEEFAYRTSHDLKAPLMSNARLIELIQADLKANKLEKSQINLELVTQSLRKLHQLVSDMVILSSVSDPSSSESISLSSFAESALQRCGRTYQTDQKNYSLTLEGDECFTTQARHITFILDNLLSNATKYSHNTGRNPEIHLTILADDEGLLLKVRDNGIGIPRQHTNDVFTMFRRFHPKHTSGSGLGLYMVKKSVEQLNGQIKYTSLAVGTEFQVFIPAIRSV